MTDVLVEVLLEHHRYECSLRRNDGKKTTSVLDHTCVCGLKVIFLDTSLYVRLHAVNDSLLAVVTLIEVLVCYYSYQLAVKNTSICHREG